MSVFEPKLFCREATLKCMFDFLLPTIKKSYPIMLREDTEGKNPNLYVAHFYLNPWKNKKKG